MAETLDPMVVAIDFSETSEEAWAAGCRLAVKTGSRVHLLHVSPDPLKQAWAENAIAVDYYAVSEEWQRRARERLAAIAPVAGLSEDRITRVVISGVPHTAITQYAAAEGAGLIVVGTHGYGPLKHLLLGSVAERVVRQAPCPVMTVPHRSIVTQARKQQEPTEISA